MVLHLGRNFIIWIAIFLFLLYVSNAMETTTLAKSDEDNSSSEETTEDLNETERQKRSAELPDSGNSDDKTKEKGIQPRISIPGLPDPATILKVAEILKTVGDQVIPILIEGNDGTSAFAEHFGDSMQFLNRFKKDIEQFTQNRIEKIS